MPRSTRPTSNAPPTKKRTANRNTQAKVYEIPESPSSSTHSKEARQEEGQAQESIESSPSADSSVSARAGGRGRARTASSATLTNDNEATPTQPQPKQTTRGAPPHAQPLAIPGFEALEAVNGLYQKLKDSQATIECLQLEKQELCADARN